MLFFYFCSWKFRVNPLAPRRRNVNSYCRADQHSMCYHYVDTLLVQGCINMCHAAILFTPRGTISVVSMVLIGRSQIRLTTVPNALLEKYIKLL